MPKIIPELRERFLLSAKQRLLRDHDLTIRQIAQDCETAVGTVYNYFPSKESLLAAVMMEDWRTCLNRMLTEASAEDTALEALHRTTDALSWFSSPGDMDLSEVLSELLLYASRTENGFVRITRILEKILQ